MAALPLTLRPFRDYNEKDVINLFSLNVGQTLSQVVPKGTLVAITADWRNDNDPTQIIGTYGDFSVNNVQALRYGTVATVGYANASATGSVSGKPIGITLFDVRELDENTIPLKYNLRKAAELEACISGQAVPIVTKGLFLYSGLTGAFGAGAPLYSNGVSGGLTAFPTLAGSGGAAGNNYGFASGEATNFRVGYALGATGVDGSAFIRIDII